MIKRIPEQRIRDRLFTGKAILLVGPRQTGTTTLIKTIFGSEPGVAWLNGDDPETRLLLEEVTTLKWKRILGDSKVLILDEAQRITDIGLKLKLITDQIPEVQVVASGSSAFELANRVNEPLTGRKWAYHLFPLSYAEMEAHHGFVEEYKRIPERLVYGYYPEVVNHPGEGIHANSFFWRTQDHQEIDYIEERDGKMWAYEMKWSARVKPSFSKTFTRAYPEHELKLIHRENYYEWLAGDK